MSSVTVHSDFGAQESKVFHCFIHSSPIYLPWNDGTKCHALSFQVLSFKPDFSLSSFTFIKRLFSSSSLLFAIRVVSSAYLRLLIILLAILIPAYASSNLAFCMMYSARKLKKQGDNIHPWCILYCYVYVSLPDIVLHILFVIIWLITQARWITQRQEFLFYCCIPSRDTDFVD